MTQNDWSLYQQYSNNTPHMIAEVRLCIGIRALGCGIDIKFSTRTVFTIPLVDRVTQTAQ